MVKFVVGVVAGVLLAGVAVVGVQFTRLDREAQFTQPSSVSYSDERIHTATVFHRRSYLAPVVGTDRFEVVLGSDPNGSYGHTVRFEATDLDTSDLEVTWDEGGALITYGSGHAVRVPAAMFTGGR